MTKSALRYLSGLRDPDLPPVEVETPDLPKLPWKMVAGVKEFHLECELVAVAQASDVEFIASNPGNWMLHCHMVHHMMNHMVEQVGPRIREEGDVSRYKTSLVSRPRAAFPHADPRFLIPGYPQMMQGMQMTPEAMEKINGRRQTRGMRHHWHEGVKGLMTVVRVLPDDLYDLVMNRDDEIKPGQVFDEIVRRRTETQQH